jgi:hypothetical protein
MDVGTRKPPLVLLSCLFVVGIVAWAYSPLRSAGFVWDDRIFLLEDASWRVGSEWFRGIFREFFDTKNYFRPLPALALIAQLRAFAASAAAMHVVSLTLHLLNVLLVGIAARRLAAFDDDRQENAAVSAAMLLYGLHPLLIEPVAWIACQVELLLTSCILLGVYCHVAIRNLYWRAAAVSICFFLAACCKEAAASFPLLLLVIDWQLGRLRGGWRSVSRESIVYGSVLAAGVCYLLLRRWGLGYLVSPSAADSGVFARLQLVCESYLTYWKMILWPMNGLNPLHEYATDHSVLTLTSAAIDLAALALFSFGVFRLVASRPIGALIIATTVALLPMLHIVPVDLDDSLYHDRWAMTATAIACTYLPVTWRAFQDACSRRTFCRALSTTLVVVWLAFAVFNIRVTLPLWSNEVRLWQWALHDNPRSLIAQDNLLAVYIESGDLGDARELAARFLADERDCLDCMLNVAQVAILEHDSATANQALVRAQQAMKSQPPSRRHLVAYICKVGDLRRQQGDLAGAESAYKDAIKLDPMIPEPHFSLATVLARQGRAQEARRVADDGIALIAPEQRPKAEREFERLLGTPAGRKN